MPRRRLFVDVSGETCPTKGSAEILDALQQAVAQRGLQDEVAVLPRGCFGLCRLAPNLYVEPDGVWYSHVTLADVAEIVEAHLVHNRIVQRLVHYHGGVHDPTGGRAGS